MEYLFGKKKKKREKAEGIYQVRLLFLLFPLHLKKGEKEKTCYICTNFESFDERSILSVA